MTIIKYTTAFKALHGHKLLILQLCVAIKTLFFKALHGHKDTLVFKALQGHKYTVF